MSRLSTVAPRHEVSAGESSPYPAQRECQPGDRFRDAATADGEGFLFLYLMLPSLPSAVSSVPSSSSPVGSVSVRCGTAVWESVGATETGIPIGPVHQHRRTFEGATDAWSDADLDHALLLSAQRNCGRVLQNDSASGSATAAGITSRDRVECFKGSNCELSLDVGGVEGALGVAVAGVGPAEEFTTANLEGAGDVVPPSSSVDSGN